MKMVDNTTPKSSPMTVENSRDVTMGVRNGRASGVLRSAESIVSQVSAETLRNNNITRLDMLHLSNHHGGTMQGPLPQVGNPLFFYLPPVGCSTPATLHPLYHSARHECDSWLLSVLKPKTQAYAQFLVQSLHPLFVCLTMPEALNSRILPLCKLVAWLFVLDNFSDELLLMSGGDGSPNSVTEKDYYDHIISLLEHGRSSGNIESNAELSRMSDVFLDVWDEIKSQMPARQQKRFIRILQDIFDATLRQSDNRDEQGIADLNTYLSFRKYTGEGYAFMIMSEFGTGIDLDDEVVEHPDIVKLQELVAYHVAYVNDLLSFRKEFCLGHHQNLPSILCVHEGYNLQESIFRVCVMIRGLDDEFVSLKKKVTMNTSLMERKGVKEYLDVLGYVMSGFLEWGYQTGRYHGLNNHLTLRQGLVSLVHLDFTLITQGVAKSELFADYS